MDSSIRLFIGCLGLFWALCLSGLFRGFGIPLKSPSRCCRLILLEIGTVEKAQTSNWEVPSSTYMVCQSINS
jgi:hypothetical protein